MASFSVGAMGINAFSLAAEIDVNPIAYAVPPAITLISAFVYTPTQNMLMCLTTAGIVHNPCQSNMPGVKLYGYFFLHDEVVVVLLDRIDVVTGKAFRMEPWAMAMGECAARARLFAPDEHVLEQALHVGLQHRGAAPIVVTVGIDDKHQGTPASQIRSISRFAS